MKKNVSVSPAILAALLVAAGAAAQTNDLSSPTIWQKKDDDNPFRNRFALSYRMGINITASFKNVGVVPTYYTVPNIQGVPGSALVNPGPPTSGQNHVYDNGYNQVDTTGNAAGYTSYWGYQNAGQIAGNSVVMDSLAPTLGAGGQAVGGPQSGLELSYNRELGRLGKWRWGLEAALGWMDVSLNDNATAAGNYTLTQDTYGLGPVSPNPPPYKGLYTAPPGQAVISDAPQRTVSYVASTGQESLTADVYSLRLGPYVEIPLVKKRLSFLLSGGLALLYVRSDFTFQEAVMEENVGLRTFSGSGSHSDFEAGGYVAGNLSLKLSRAVDVFAGLQYMKVENYHQVDSGEEAELKFGNSFFVTVGAGYSF